MGRIDRIEINNFKSYGGHHVIGPFRHFACIVGPNGSGKSNLMDAISFVLGVQSNKLRGSGFGELIFKKNSEEERPSDRDGFVEIVYENDAKEEILFRRRILSTGVTKYSVDGKTVKWDTV
jgi:structural maintenance of chromosome 1